MSRKKKNGPPIKRSDSATLVPEEAGLLAQGGGPVGRPAWAPGDFDLFKVPEPVRQAVAEIVEPAYRQMVAAVEDPLERSIGLTLVQSGVRDQVSETGTRPGGETEGNVENLKTATQKTRCQLTGISCQ